MVAGALFNNSEKGKEKGKEGGKREGDHRQSKRGKFLIIIEP